jgi:hypothetical protein
MQNNFSVTYDWFARNLQDFGSRGDNTLEYAGVTFRTDSVLRKVYRTAPQPQRMPDIFQKIWTGYFQQAAACFPLAICDYSCSTFQGQESCRMVVNLTSALTPEELAKLTGMLSGVPDDRKQRMLGNAGRVLAAFHTKKGVLRQIGIETDHAGRLLNLKYYLFTDKVNAVHGYTEEQLQCLAATAQTPVSCDSTLLLRRIEMLGNCKYLPIFVGINDSDALYEVKLYFISQLFGREIPVHAHEQAVQLLHTTGLASYILPDELDRIGSLPLFLEGAAFTLNEAPDWRLYWREIPERMLKK